MMLDHHYVRPERWIRRQKGPAVWDTCVLLLRLEYKVSHKSSCLNAQSQMVVPFWEVRETLGGSVSWEEVGSFGACGRAVFFPFSLPVPCSASSRNEVEKLLCRVPAPTRMPRPSAWGHLTTGLSPVNENNSWHSSLISNVWLSKPFLWHLWHQPVPWRKLTSLARMLCHTLIFHNSRAHNHWSQHGKVLGKGTHCRLTVSLEGKEWEAISLFLCFFSGQWCRPGRLHLHA